jgi:hypothetical protein
VPIAQFILIGVACGALARHVPDSRPLLAAAGAAAGLAAWTKNEGQAFFILLLIGITTWRKPGASRAWVWFGLGAAPPLTALLWFKLRIAPDNYLFAQGAVAGLVERLRDADRWTLIRTQLTEMAPAWGDVPGGALGLLAGVVALTARADARALQRCAFGLAAIGLMMIGYILVYAITPLPLLWQILTSFARLVTQLWPALVWTVFQISGAGIDDRRRVTAT